MKCIDQTTNDHYALYNGDCCEVIREIPDDSIDVSVYSPPFSNLYIYSDSERDMGNAENDEEFIEHYKFFLPELLRATVPGRLSIVHCKDLPKYANTHGTTGLVDFPGKLVAAHEECGWSFHSRITIWKCPVVERERTNNNGLLHKTVLRDRSQVRQGMADFLLVFRKPPVGTLMSDKPVTVDISHIPYAVPIEGEGFMHYIGENNPLEGGQHPSPYSRKKVPSNKSIAIWQRYADPVWFDINQTNVLNYKAGRGSEDERHICPLQVDLIRRCVQIWSNPGEVVFSPFAGIGSEGYGAIKEGRRFIGVELKSEYYNVAIRNMNQAIEESRQQSLFRKSQYETTD